MQKMKEALNDKDPKGIRNQKSSYQKISDEINAWPDWKKKAYNEIFAISTHAKKIPI